MNALLRLFGRSRSSNAQPPKQEDSWLDPRDLGLRDSVMGGWFHSNGELFDGFPITAEDIVLDVGCGDGGFASYCARRGAHVLFADINPELVAAARNRLSLDNTGTWTPIVTNSTPLPLKDGAATRVIATEILEHVEDPAKVMRELSRVGRPGALYLLSVPDPISEEIQRDLFPARYAEETGHLRIFKREEFRGLVADSGLVILAQRLTGFFWSLWFTLFWNSGVDRSDLRHPSLDNWVRTWEALLDTPDGSRVKEALDRIMPKNQIIVARKP